MQYLLSLNNILHWVKKDKDNLINPKTYINLYMHVFHISSIIYEMKNFNQTTW